ncbi:uncharacterized protein LOC106084046 [Stomoxys calcitrans]|uniref:Uncharacterized protein n=1 Tax=Stomoxys calcitrans TaxID=35570 RepID=A0A1I8PYL1_STOCA|nr:uncharacterized protein LOC106084046 [Stomoxys calcitrans]
MHQVLSYETAVRANTSSEYREYVTKRTCISLVLTIAFFTLISGYLLGNFVSERKNHIRMMLTKKAPNTASEASSPNTIDISSTDYMNLQELHAYQKIKSKLLASAQNLSKLQQGEETYRSKPINTDIFNRYISCTQDVPYNTTNELSQFIEQLIDNTSARQKECMRRIQAIIDHNLTTF